MEFRLEDSFTRSLPGDDKIINTRRQVLDACYSLVNPKAPVEPKLLHVSDETRSLLGFEAEFVRSTEFLNIFSGKTIIPGSTPYAMNYGGHQFGHWAGQLGDGRAINLGEVVNKNGRFTLQLKGAGATPYSRNADGLAVLRSSIREHLCSEAMFHLGVPTTRSLSLMLSGEQVLRDIMYDGNPEYEQGAIVCRVAPSFIRFGNFQIHMARKEYETLKKLADFTIDTYFTDITSSGKDKYIEFFKSVTDKTVEMIVHWQRVGFVHGVMNTDNMSILGLTIDYGPYGWQDDYNPDWTPNTTDKDSRRYRFGQQPYIAQWNLYQLANALFPLIEDAKVLEAILSDYNTQFSEKYLFMMSEKLGIPPNSPQLPGMVKSIERLLVLVETDMTIFFRNLSKITKKDSPGEAFIRIKPAFYALNELNNDIKQAWNDWLERYLFIISSEEISDASRKQTMNKVNPKYVLRNYLAQQAIEKAENGDYSEIDILYTMLKNPYEEQLEFEKYFSKRPDWAREKIGCSMLSCSS